MTDSEQLFDTNSFHKYDYGPLKIETIKSKAICLRRDILADYFHWIYKGLNDDDLYPSSKDKADQL